MPLAKVTCHSPQLERWSLSLHLTRPLEQVPHVGSMLRGAFGHALRSLACRCNRERHAPDCAYHQVFEPAAPANWPSRYQQCPPAYVLTPPGECLARRNQLDFSLTLLGPAVTHRALVWQAWQQAALQGLGERRVPARLRAGPAPTLRSPCTGARQVRLQLLSPLLLKRKLHGQTESQPLRPDEIGITDLLIALHRRLDLTHRLYGVPALPLPALDDWLAQSGTLELRTELSEIHFARRSNRQQKRMPLYGVTGHLDLRGPLAPDLLHALSLGQWLHIGGKVSFGMGGYRLLVPSAPPMRFTQKDFL